MAISKKGILKFKKEFNPKKQSRPISDLETPRISNPGHNILELYNFLVLVQFTTSKTKLDI